MNGCGISFWGGKTRYRRPVPGTTQVFGTTQKWWLYNIVNVLNATDLFALKWLFECYVNFTGKKKTPPPKMFGCIFPVTKKWVWVCTYLEDKADVAEVPSLVREVWVLPQKHTLKAPSPDMLPAYN